LPAVAVDSAPPADGSAEGGLQQSLHITIGAHSTEALSYTFFYEDQAQDIHLRFPSGTKVGEAREALGRHFGVPPEAVALHFMGKALRDGFMMERLRLGDTKIQVYLKDDRPVLLLTAKANRNPS
jgi:hypothetical protein